MNSDLAVLIPSRGLPCAESIHALDMDLEELRERRGIQSYRRWALNWEMPHCRNDLIEQFDALSPTPSFVLWCDDDMAPPVGTLVKFLDALDSMPQEIVGVTAQVYSSHRGTPSPPVNSIVSCLMQWRIPHTYPKDWIFTAGGGLAFSLWRGGFFESLERPVFTLSCGEDAQLHYKIREAGCFVRAFPEIIIGHCYVQEFKPKGGQGSHGQDWNGCHVIKRYEDAIQQRKQSAKSCAERKTVSVA